MSLLTPSEFQKLTAPAKREKYNRSSADDRTWNGVVYDSKREMVMAQSYEVLLRAGALKRIDRQVKFPIVWPGGDHICTVIIDFKLTHPDGSLEAVEVKGFPTPVWRIKEKLFRAAYPKWRLTVIK